MSLILVCSFMNGNDIYLMELLGVLSESREKAQNTVVSYQVFLLLLFPFFLFQYFPSVHIASLIGALPTLGGNSHDFLLLARC